MHPVVRSFRATLVESRFGPPFAALGMIGMRVALFCGGGLPQTASRGDNYLWEPVARFSTCPAVSLAASTLSVFIIAWILSLLNSRFNLLRSRSNLPFTVPLFLLSLHPFFLVMSGDYISMALILLAFFPLLESYQKPDSYLSSFQASILVATASLFQIYALVLIPLWWRGERLMRAPRLRSFVSSLFGVFLVYVTLFSVYWVLDDIPGFVRPLLRFISFPALEIPAFSIQEWGGVLFAGFYFISGMVLSNKIYTRDKALTLSLMQFVVFLIVFLLLLHVVYWQKTLFFLLLSIMLSFFLNAYFYSKTVSKTHIYLAYGMLSLMVLFYLSHLLPSMEFLL